MVAFSLELAKGTMFINHCVNKRVFLLSLPTGIVHSVEYTYVGHG